LHVDDAWLDRIGPADGQEASMLEFCEGVDSTSRLGCQIKVGPELDGIVVRTPLTQH
jgi:2Fe-2S ferredoxin